VPQRDLSLKHGVSKSMISIIKKKNKENLRKRIGENEAKPSIQICHYEGSALGFCPASKRSQFSSDLRDHQHQSKSVRRKIG
jgi:hypothetical protein